MPMYEIRIEPVDPLLFGDNRSARAGFDHLLRDQDPSPLTLHGAVGQYIADRSPDWPLQTLGERQPDILNPRVWPLQTLGERQPDILNPRGKVAEMLGFCLQGAGGGLLFPAPRHLRCVLRHGEPQPWDLLTPREEAGVKISVPWGQLLLAGDEHRLESELEGEVLLSPSALGEVLCGETPASANLPSQAFRAEPRPGIAVDNASGNVFEGQLFTRPYRRFKPAACEKAAQGAPAGFAVWLETLGPVELRGADPIGFLGGDRRRARFSFRDAGEAPLRDLREQVAAAAGASESRGFLLALLTPALQNGERVEIDGAQPVAAALGKPAHASGWDVRQNLPRPVRTLLPAGSVYFFEWPRGIPAGPQRAELIRRLWCRALHQEGAAAGFGRCLPGIWR